MKLNETQPQELAKENKILRSIDIKEMIEKKDSFVQVDCPACKGKSFKKEFKKEGFDFVKCNNCETLYVNPRPTEEMIHHFYTTARNIEHWNEKIFPISEKARKEHICKPRVQKILKLCKQQSIKGVLIDVGAGSGVFCQEMKHENYFSEVIAVEPSAKGAESCKQKGVKTYESPIEKAENLDADVITNFELIEHLFDPDIFLRGCYDSLKENGILVLTTPNILGFDISLLKEKSDTVSAPNHINYFTPESLKILLERHRFKLIDIITPGSLDVQILSRKIDSGDYALECPFLKQVFQKQSSKDAFQEFISENQLSSHMWAIAQKSI